MTNLDLTADMIDVRDIIARVETLEDECDPTSALADADSRAELASLRRILDALRGYGGDEQWRGDWYPVTLIKERHFTDYARELVLECDVTFDLPHYIQIDWDATARNVRVDYSCVDIAGNTFLYR